ncbi:MAG: hypothetical protein M3R30_04965 [Candidatus Eremiobacteraeota bacterium]|nr:hypothetical protein [Candidatus Eremiobacteraeota bacterium]
MRLARAIWALPVALVVGALGARGLLSLAPAAIATDLAQPLVVANTWHAYGALQLAMLALAVAGGGIVYFGLLRAVASGRATISVGSIVGLAAVGLIGALAWPFVFSSDVYAYATYGDLAARGLDPYAHASIFPADATVRAALWQWGGAIPACVYGPLFVDLASGVTSAFGSFGTFAQLFALRALACASLLACAPLAFAAFAGRLKSERTFAAAAIGLNPLAIWSAAEGHNDALVLAVALAGFALARRYGPFVGALLATISLGVKAPGLLAAFGIAVAYRAPSRALVHALSGIAVGGALVALACLPYAGGLLAVGARGHYLPTISLQAIWPPLGVAAALAALGFGLRAVLRGDSGGWPLAALGLWLAIPNPQPWYGLWFLPIAALAPRSPAAWVLVGLSLTTVLRYIPDAVAIPSYPLDLAFTLIAFAPLLLLWPHSRSTS